MSKHPEDSLAGLGSGATCTVQHVRCERPVALRLMEMGLLPGTRVAVTRIGPFGDPIELRVRSYALSIRRSEAASVAVAEVRQPEPAAVALRRYETG